MSNFVGQGGATMMKKNILMKPVIALIALITVLLLLSPTLATADEPIVGTEHWVQSVSGADGKPLKLYVWEKRLKAADPSAFAKSGKVVLLAHGAGTPGRIAFDLQVPEKSAVTYSLMDHLGGQGFDVFAIDYQNYGRSDQHPCGLCVTTQVAANDVNAVVDYIRKLRGVDKVHLLGWSWGTNVTGLFTMQHPEKVNRLVLYAPPVWSTPRDQAPTEEFRTVTPDNSRRLFEPPASDAVAVETWVKEVAQWGPKAPNGVILDLNTKMPLTDPTKITAPTMIILGDLDRLTPINQPNLPGFFTSLPNTDKQLIIVPGAGHALTVQKPRLRFYSEVAKWFSVD
jgi:pimeloyl-ACP methyl ester carboxylesterase